ncbi:class I SAM-dependent methyltransferase [Methylobacterium sp. E-005]|nr:class I SAM-dependent methyltransferase [Methylobacterium sp. E-005]
MGLMTGARRILSPGGVLFPYGPFFEDQRETAPSNHAFDLRCRDHAWGLPALSDVDAAARREGLHWEARIATPANNVALVYQKG